MNNVEKLHYLLPSRVYEKAVEWNIKSNPHPMVKYRTNCPLARMDVFKLMYNILPGDKMYWKSDTIWSN